MEHCINWLVDYLIKHFKLPAVGRHEFSKEMVVHMLEYKWYAEDPRAWRKYVARVQRGLRRRTLTSGESDRLAALPDGLVILAFSTV